MSLTGWIMLFVLILLVVVISLAINSVFPKNPKGLYSTPFQLRKDDDLLGQVTGVKHDRQK